MADPQALMPAVARSRDSFGLVRLVMIGDRGMTAEKAIDTLRQQEALTGSPRSAAPFAR